LARWLSPDPASFSGGDLNLYSYVRNRPSSAVDPTGYQIWHCAIQHCPVPPGLPLTKPPKPGGCYDRVEKSPFIFASGYIRETDIAEISGGGCGEDEGTYYSVFVRFTSWVPKDKECNWGAESQIRSHKTGEKQYLPDSPCEWISPKYDDPTGGNPLADFRQEANCISVLFEIRCPVSCEGSPARCVPDPESGTLHIGTTPRSNRNFDTVVSWEIRYPIPDKCGPPCPLCNYAKITSLTVEDTIFP
jgi:hypothetical protein